MSTNVNALQLRRVWGREGWLPAEPFGSDGWRMFARDLQASIIVTCDDFDGAEWVHASIARQMMPTYDDLVTLHRSVWGDTGYAHQIFAPRDQHVNIHAHALHLWGRRDGARVLPDFGAFGTI